MITSKCYSDDHQVEVEFDATDWFKQASTKEIIDLSICDWGGGYASDKVAEFFRDNTTSKLFDYNELINTIDQKDLMGFENHVNEQESLEWLYKNRPSAIVAIEEFQLEILRSATNSFSRN